MVQCDNPSSCSIRDFCSAGDYCHANHLVLGVCSAEDYPGHQRSLWLHLARLQGASGATNRTGVSHMQGMHLNHS